MTDEDTIKLLEKIVVEHLSAIKEAAKLKGAQFKLRAYIHKGSSGIEIGMRNH